MNKLKALYGLLRHPIQSFKGTKAIKNLTHSPAFSDTLLNMVHNADPDQVMSFDDLLKGTWKNNYGG